MKSVKLDQVSVGTSEGQGEDGTEAGWGSQTTGGWYGRSNTRCDIWPTLPQSWCDPGCQETPTTSPNTQVTGSTGGRVTQSGYMGPLGGIGYQGGIEYQGGIGYQGCMGCQGVMGSQGGVGTECGVLGQGYGVGYTQSSGGWYGPPCNLDYSTWSPHPQSWCHPNYPCGSPSQWGVRFPCGVGTIGGVESPGGTMGGVGVQCGIGSLGGSMGSGHYMGTLGGGVGTLGGGVGCSQTSFGWCGRSIV